MTTLHARQRQRQRRFRQRPAGALITPTVTRWHPAARAVGWALLLLTLAAFWFLGLG